MRENNAAQAAENDEVQRIKDRGPAYPHTPDAAPPTPLSKLRAPVADERAAFARAITGRDDLEPHQVENVIDANGSRWKTWQDRAALASAPVPNAGNWQQYRLRGSNETAEQIIERERKAYADLLQSVMDKRREQASAPLAAPSNETLRLAGVIADKIEDGTLFQAGIFSRRELADKVRAVVRFVREASAPDTAKETADKILRERMAPISEALGLDVMLASVLKDGFQIITFEFETLVYSIGSDGAAILRVSFNCSHAPDTLTADQVQIISRAAAEVRPVGGEVLAWLDQHRGVTSRPATAMSSLELYRQWRATEQAQAAAPCTCPSGDGSLRHPCAAHPAKASGNGGEEWSDS
ncbi:hypothetical protein L7Q78_18900 [Achromobacter xylosoxidans]|uniref:hypothetical protein n=1 Tax=Alcaligenes xylosoxydans xylosoxydans TaxID=85698 RepID=UPI001F05A9EF|nr:hypothetical protein [Achromobacter xylosoxidans]MCH1984852.1 hypothetical protein [Achromobacter xylosoxidans]MCH1994862.1 hypothetical protein [Achromobacter xylosoxidans]MCH4586015.1 hypothetical protein [Achromobacter xylosoxidans]